MKMAAPMGSSKPMSDIGAKRMSQKPPGKKSPIHSKKKSSKKDVEEKIIRDFRQMRNT